MQAYHLKEKKMTTKEQFYDYLPRFKEWLILEQKQKKTTVSARMSNIKTIGEHYDIMMEFSLDKCQSLFDELQYSKSDIEPKTSIVINGDYYTGLATYRQSLRLFVAFLENINYSYTVTAASVVAKFIGSFDEFKRYVGPKCRNEVNIFCKSERKKHNGICEYCGAKHELQSAHVTERPVIIKTILDNDYRIGADLYEVNLEEFFLKFKNAHMPISDNIFFLCKKCHNMLDKDQSISIADIKAKRPGFHAKNQQAKFLELLNENIEIFKITNQISEHSMNLCIKEENGIEFDVEATFINWAKENNLKYVVVDVANATQSDVKAITASLKNPTVFLFQNYGDESAPHIRNKISGLIKDRYWNSEFYDKTVLFSITTITKNKFVKDIGEYSVLGDILSF